MRAVHGAGDSGDLVPVPEGDEGGDGAYGEAPCQAGFGFGVDLQEADMRLQFGGGALECWGHGVARPTPVRPEICDDGQAVAAEIVKFFLADTGVADGIFPFLVIDMIVASVLMSLGMMMLSPVMVALPFKLMLFVLADGWNLLLGSLAASFAQ